jgi:DNA-binding response OmpR family regulator
MDQIQETIGTEPHVFPQVLIMEDEPSVGKGLQMVLTESGYIVDVATTGQSALDTFNKKDFDLLVADLRLPDIDGMEVIRKVKHDRPDTEVVVITGYSTVPSAVEAMKLGACDYLSKPFSDDEFKSAVKGALGGREEKFTKEALDTFETEDRKLIQKKEVMRVLDRTAMDEKFWCMLMENSTEVLKEYHLSSEARAAITSGDLDWIKNNVGKLSKEQLTSIYRILEREVW